MIHVRALDRLPSELRGACFAMGAFDGLHPGHRAVISLARSRSEALGAPLGVLTFEPSPRAFFQPGGPSMRLMSPERRARILSSLGADLCVSLPFDAATAAMTDADFVSRVLHDGLAARAVAVGFDFRFGKGRMGDVASLARLAADCGFEALIADPVGAPGGGEKVSSSSIRALIRAGEMEAAAGLLGDWWIVDGVVEHGEKRGRTLGFPTANLHLGDLIQPPFGVYAVWARPEGERAWRPAAASFGRTPTTGLRDPLLEVFIFDYSGDLYGRRLETAFAVRLRPELVFPSIEALTVQMAADVAEAATLLRRLDPPSET
ncbi:MAG: riboflavin biosynthesis protein RibF [Alphaproteobacteria bacterium]|nr:riboflavin biosynthesis protein RibF [Alphaproteobacteria bacterium]